MDIVNTTLKAGSVSGRLCKSLLATLLVSFSMLLSPVAISETETITWILTDHLGSPVVGRDDSYSRVVWGQGYTPFGEKVNYGSWNPAPRDIGYTGHYFDHDMQLLYAGARWYDPKVGRFLSPDSVRFQTGGAVHFNRYAYAANSPYRYVDPDGNESREAAWAALGDEDPGRALAQGARSVAEGASAVGEAIEPDWVSAIPFVGPFMKGLKGADKGLGNNPFKGKTREQIADMFRKKGFEPKGPDPVNGKGTFVNPKTGRAYHIDADHPLPKPPHVGVGRPRGTRDSDLPKSRDYDL